MAGILMGNVTFNYLEVLFTFSSFSLSLVMKYPAKSFLSSWEPRIILKCSLSGRTLVFVSVCLHCTKEELCTKLYHRCIQIVLTEVMEHGDMGVGQDRGRRAEFLALKSFPRSLMLYSMFFLSNIWKQQNEKIYHSWVPEYRISRWLQCLYIMGRIPGILLWSSEKCRSLFQSVIVTQDHAGTNPMKARRLSSKLTWHRIKSNLYPMAFKNSKPNIVSEGCNSEWRKDIEAHVFNPFPSNLFGAGGCLSPAPKQFLPSKENV